MKMEIGQPCVIGKRHIPKEIPILSANWKTSKEYKNPPQTLGFIGSLVKH
jgi:hypothetical protein